MEVKVKIDKFGRILILKKAREAKGYEYGMELSLVMEPESEVLPIVRSGGKDKALVTPENTEQGQRPFRTPSLLYRSF